MNFLEARRIVSAFPGGPELRFLLAMSGTPDALDVFLRASAAQRGYSLAVRTLPFNTLMQWMFGEPASDEREVVLLFPWDLVPETDWRSGVPASAVSLSELRARSARVAERLARRTGARFLYVPAPVPPLFPDVQDDARLRSHLLSLAHSLGADVLPAECFALGGYLASGNPFAGARLDVVAERIVGAAAPVTGGGMKVLVTDLDNVLWHGVIGEDGIEGIRCAAEGVGYRFFLYQTLLARLEREGALLAAVSRNDEELALSPFRAGRTHLREEQFVCILASYNAKSAQVAEIASRLNLGLDSFVFVDDNPLEIAEVSTRLPQVRCVQFPQKEEQLPAFFATLSALFSRTSVTAEDSERTALYRRRLEGIAPSVLEGADLTEFLRSLEMSLTIHDRTTGDRTRAVQLINKTNQFNLNGRRVTDAEVTALLAAGGRLYTASLSDRTGSHGEILACLITPDGVIDSLVMSCRVFQRRVEHAFFAWLSSRDALPRRLSFSPTDRNEPVQQFVRDPAFTPAESGGVYFDAARFASVYGGELDLFRVEAPGWESGGRTSGVRAGGSAPDSPVRKESLPSTGGNGKVEAKRGQVLRT